MNAAPVLAHNSRMATAVPPSKQADRKLTLREVLDWLVEDGLVARDAAQKVLQAARVAGTGTRHPVVAIAEARLRSAQPPHKTLTAEALSEWLAGRVKMPFYRIDPLKIDLKAVTQVMSSEYAQRRGILPVEVTGRELTIATARAVRPRVGGTSSPRCSSLEVRRVIANPADIERYQVEFFNLAKSMKRAQQARPRPRAACRTSSSWSSWAAATSSSTPTTSTWSRSSTGCGSTPSTSARATSTSSRGATSASCASASTACCTRSTRCPPRCCSAMTSRASRSSGAWTWSKSAGPQDGRIKTRTPDGRGDRAAALDAADRVRREAGDAHLRPRGADARLQGPRLHAARTTSAGSELTDRPDGIVLVTGPTGSGKTTTLYSTLKQLATAEVNVCTIEDPIEMIEPRVQPDAGAAGDRARLRRRRCAR